MVDLLVPMVKWLGGFAHALCDVAPAGEIRLNLHKTPLASGLLSDSNHRIALFVPDSGITKMAEFKPP
jgi:hypothetical protein